MECVINEIRPPFRTCGRSVVRRIGLGVVLLMAACHGKGNSCISDTDCFSSEIASQLGRCFPIEAYCKAGGCVAYCAQPCRTVNSMVSACSDDSLICNDASQAPEQPFCTGLPIRCTTVDQCPLYRPIDTQGAQREWTCADGICSYPGWHYASGRPSSS
jgi:hypothetical protein